MWARVRHPVVTWLGAAVCSISCAQIAGSKDPEGADPNAIVITPAALDFGGVKCMTEPTTPQVITIRNTGAVPSSYKFVLPEGTAFRLDGATEGTVQPNDVATISVFVKPTDAQDFASDILVTVGAKFQTVHATAKGTGSTVTLAPGIADFGDVRKEAGGSPIGVDVRNTGTEDAIVSFTGLPTPEGFDVSWPGKPAPLTVPAGQSRTVDVSFAQGAETQPLDLQIPLKVDGTPCGTPPAIGVKGRRITTEVTVAPVDWGRQPCNATPGPKDVVITNYSKSTVTYTVAPPVAFDVVDPGPGTLGPALVATTPTTAAISVQPKPLGAMPTLVQEDLHVTIAGAPPGSSGDRPATLRVDVRGAVLVVSPTTITTFQSNGGFTDTKTFTVQNTGNESISLDWALARTAGGPAWSAAPPSDVGPNETRQGVIGFNPSTFDPNTATLTPSVTAGVACSGLVSLSLSGHAY